MKKLRFILLIVLQTDLLSSCTVDMGAWVVPDFYEHDWYCEELEITSLNKTLASYAIMEYNGQRYTKEYYEELSILLDMENPNPEEYEEFYPAMQAFINFDGNFYVSYVEFSIYFDDIFQKYTWCQESLFVLRGDVKNKGSYIKIKVQEDNLFNGEYAGKTIYFHEI